MYFGGIAAVVPIAGSAAFLNPGPDQQVTGRRANIGHARMKVLPTFAIALLVSGCVGSTRPPPPRTDFGPETLSLINSYRASRGLPRLASHAALKALARQHGRRQAARRDIGHDGYGQRMAQARSAGLSGFCVENVGFGHQNAQQLFSAWTRSSRHSRNLLRPDMRYAGVSVVGGYATFFACR